MTESLLTFRNDPIEPSFTPEQRQRAYDMALRLFASASVPKSVTKEQRRETMGAYENSMHEEGSCESFAREIKRMVDERLAEEDRKALYDMFFACREIELHGGVPLRGPLARILL